MSDLSQPAAATLALATEAGVELEHLRAEVGRLEAALRHVAALADSGRVTLGLCLEEDAKAVGLLLLDAVRAVAERATR